MNSQLANAPARIALRAEQAEDCAFLESLFVSIRWPEFDGAGWPDELRRRFLNDQFALQDRHYKGSYPGAEYWIIEQESRPAGRLYLFEDSEDLRIVDISLSAEFRGVGLGTFLLNSVLSRARDSGKSASIHVEQNNPARRLYSRLGFREVNAEGPYILMKWSETGTQL